MIKLLKNMYCTIFTQKWDHYPTFMIMGVTSIHLYFDRIMKELLDEPYIMSYLHYNIPVIIKYTNNREDEEITILELINKYGNSEDIRKTIKLINKKASQLTNSLLINM